MYRPSGQNNTWIILPHQVLFHFSDSDISATLSLTNFVNSSVLVVNFFNSAMFSVSTRWLIRLVWTSSIIFIVSCPAVPASAISASFPTATPPAAAATPAPKSAPPSDFEFTAAYAEIADATIALDFALARLANVIKNLNIYPKKMLKNLNITNGIFFSQRILLELTTVGFTREESYKIVQKNAMNAWKQNSSFFDNIISDKKITNKIPVN